jgi:hypothetical protein
LLKKKRSTQEKGKKADPLKGIYTDDQDFRLKGSLELNPYTCPGCGTPYQVSVLQWRTGD